MVRGWLDLPEVIKWWGDPVIEFTLIRQDFVDPDITQLVVYSEDHDFAFAQHYEVDARPDGGELPAGSRAVDTFIGDADFIGSGHGPSYLRVLAQMLFSDGVPMLVVDPDPENEAAVRAYTSAGFSPSSVYETPEGQVLLMEMAPNGNPDSDR